MLLVSPLMSLHFFSFGSDLAKPVMRGRRGRRHTGETEMARGELDKIDRKILDMLQRDASLSIAELAGRVFLSQTPCWKRIQKLEHNGTIERRVAILNPERIGLGLSVFVSVEAVDHSREWIQHFARTVADMPEVMELYRMAGDVDYMLRVVVPDMAAYDAFYKRLVDAIPLKNVTSRFAMERIKQTTIYPIPELTG